MSQGLHNVPSPEKKAREGAAAETAEPQGGVNMNI